MSKAPALKIAETNQEVLTVLGVIQDAAGGKPENLEKVIAGLQQQREMLQRQFLSQIAALDAEIKLLSGILEDTKKGASGNGLD